MRRRGFTLIELLVVMAIVATLLTLALPRFFGSIDKSKEAVLKENLHQLREAISRYHADRGKYPETLEALATDKYLRSVPLDPVTDTALTVWGALGGYPIALGAIAIAAVAAAILPWARRRSPYGVAALGAVLTTAGIAAGAGVASAFVLVLVWAIAAAVASGLRRRN